jgi:hypothetical protein
MKKDSKKLAENICSRNQRLKSKRAIFDVLAQDIANYVMPRKSQITSTKTEGVEGFTSDLYNQEAIRCNGILASGQMHWLMEGRWFEFKPIRDDADDEAKTWYQKCTERMYQLFDASNLYTEAHEMFLDRGACPSAALYVEEGKKSLFNFKAHRWGTYSIEEDSEGLVDTVFCEYKMTARQMVQKFGLDNVGKLIREAYEADGGKQQDQEFDYIHAIYPREERDMGKLDGSNKPIASVYIAVKDKHLIQEGGYDEMPTFVTRFLKWGDSAYGYCPAIDALPTIRQLNFIEQQMDALAELKAFPRFLYPADMEGDIDMRANGGTPFDPNRADSIPRTWGTEGEYNIGLERVEKKEELIRKAYLVDLFQMLQQIDGGKMTAYEVAQRVAEKIPNFSPTFKRLVPELLRPMLLRCFAIAFRAGEFEEPPQSVMVPNDDGTASLAVPKVALTSKLALTIKGDENNAFLNLMQIWGSIAEMRPDVLDNIDFDKAFRGSAENFGIPADWKTSVEDRDAQREARAKQQQMAQAAELAQAGAKAAKDLAGADPAVKKAVGL